MIPYFVIIIFTLAIGLFNLQYNIKRQWLVGIFLFAVIILSIFSGLRTIGWDYNTYQDHFNSTPDIIEYSRTDISIEVGYELLVSLIKLFSGNFNFFLLIYTFLSLTVIIVLCVKYSTYPLLSFLFFVPASYSHKQWGRCDNLLP